LPQRKFIPVGHLSLGPVSAQNLDAGYVKMEEGLYWISNLYVSRALQGGGLGSAVLDTIESTATSEPLCAKVLALNAINKIDPGREEKYKALGLTIPPVGVSVIERECTNSV
jgi:GNAT superfamily N-acetyltransferase